MSTVREFDGERLEQCLRRLLVRFMRTSAGTAYAVFDPARYPDPEMQVNFAAEGDAEQVLTVRATMPRYFPAEQWPRLLGLVNNWHREHRWPKGYLDFLPERPEGPPIARLVAETQIDLGAQVHDELLDRCVNCALATAYQFLVEINSASACPGPSPAPSAQELEDWLREQSQ